MKVQVNEQEIISEAMKSLLKSHGPLAARNVLIEETAMLCGFMEVSTAAVAEAGTNEYLTKDKVPTAEELAEDIHNMVRHMIVTVREEFSARAAEADLVGQMRGDD